MSDITGMGGWRWMEIKTVCDSSVSFRSLSKRSVQRFSQFLRIYMFLVCEHLLKGIVYPLAAKSTQVLDLAHQKERIALV